MINENIKKYLNFLLKNFCKNFVLYLAVLLKGIRTQKNMNHI